ncbi:GNAT family N-acetyltransferase [Peribacillus sp. SCS-37]|uniref:GNAT family N-acetyltransferase n=1 Tax=Paraperibacillus esterisolvens TaxID=3115296 RepID=UPI003906932B
MEMRQVRKEEYKLTEDFVYEVFKHTSYSDGRLEKALVREIREKPYYLPQFDLMIEADGSLAGHVMLSRFPIGGGQGGEVLMLSPVSVAASRQRQGIGRHMVGTALEITARRGYKAVIVEGDYRYYRQFGFRTSTEFGLHASKKNLPPAPEYLMAMELCPGGLASISGEVDYSIYQALTH